MDWRIPRETCEMATTHRLGLTGGTITDHGDGTASYNGVVEFMPSFRVTIADVTGFTESKGGKKRLQNTVHVIGSGGEIASCDINIGLTPKIEKWFRAHPDFEKAPHRLRSPHLLPSRMNS